MDFCLIYFLSWLIILRFRWCHHGWEEGGKVDWWGGHLLTRRSYRDGQRHCCCDAVVNNICDRHQVHCITCTEEWIIFFNKGLPPHFKTFLPICVTQFTSIAVSLLLWLQRADPLWSMVCLMQKYIILLHLTLFNNRHAHPHTHTHTVLCFTLKIVSGKCQIRFKD